MWTNAVLTLFIVLSTFNESFGDVLRQKSHNNHHVVPSSRIIGGKEADPHSAKYMVGILLYFQGHEDFCGGILISNNFVLTAAHCLIGTERATLMLGIHKWTDEDEENRVEIEVDQNNFIIHERANILINLHDIALIKLPSKVEENDFIKIVTLPTRDDATRNYVGKIGRAYGWGLTHNVDNPQITDISEVLMYVDVAVINEQECRKSYRGLQEGTLCTSEQGDKATCTGDSGGPYLVNNTLIALTAYGDIICEEAPSVYTDVFYYMNWIEKHSDVKFKNN